jgi:hypothetical protein
MFQGDIYHRVQLIAPMFWIALAAAAQLSAAQPINYDKWFFADDVLGLPRGTWVVGVRMVVRPDGSFKDCQIEYQRTPHLAAHTCELLGHRAKYHAARWIDGSAAYGVDRFPIIWAIGGDPEHIFIPPDLDVYVDQLPRGVHSGTYVPVVIAVGADGKIEHCAADQRKDGLSEALKGHVSSDPALVAAACQQSDATLRTFPAVGEGGKPVQSVQNALVRFTVRHQ